MTHMIHFIWGGEGEHVFETLKAYVWILCLQAFDQDFILNLLLFSITDNNLAPISFCFDDYYVDHQTKSKCYFCGNPSETKSFCIHFKSLFLDWSKNSN